MVYASWPADLASPWTETEVREEETVDGKEPEK